QAGRITFFRLLCLLFCLNLLQSCSTQPQNHDNISLKFESLPFYKDFIAIDTNNVANSLTELKKNYPQFLDFYLDTVMSLDIKGQYSDTNELLNSLLTYKDYRSLFDTVGLVFPDTRE